MEWLTCIRKAIDYMEEHLEDNISAQDVAGQVFMSSFFFQKGFSLMTGYGLSEYIRNRRLYKAALDLQKTDEKIIDIAFRYCYETPESFTKAFSRFHGVSPSQVREGAPIKPFLPLKIEISIHGGNKMDGFVREVANDRQAEGIDIFRVPASLYIRAYTDKASARLLLKEKCETWELFAYIRNYLMPSHGFRMAENGAQELEVFDTSKHETGYVYMPVMHC